MLARSDADEDDAPAAQIVDPVTFAWMTEHARTLYEAETARGDGIDGKAATLAGFAGVILSIGTGVTTTDEVPDSTLVTCFSIAALLLLTGAAAFALIGVLRPQETAALDPDELRLFMTPEFTRADPADVQSRTLVSTTTVLEQNVRTNNHKARNLRRAVSLLAAGLACITALAVTLQIDADGETGAERGASERTSTGLESCPATQTPAARR